MNAFILILILITHHPSACYELCILQNAAMEPGALPMPELLPVGLLALKWPVTLYTRDTGRPTQNSHFLEAFICLSTSTAISM
jgi:hypothetical protein